MIPETLLKDAAMASCTYFTDSLEKSRKNEPEYKPSEKFVSKIKHLRHRADHPYIYHGIQRIAAVFLAILIVGSTWLAVDTEARAAFVGWIKETYDTYIVYRFSGEAEIAAKENKYRLGWIPDGYTEYMTIDQNGGVTVLYQHESGKFLKLGYIHNPNANAWYVDTDHTVRSDSFVNGQAADLFIATSSDVASIIMWTAEDDTAFYVSGFFDGDELIKIAENICIYNEPTEMVSDSPDYRPTWLPEGYSEFKVNTANGRTMVAYSNVAGEIFRFNYASANEKINWFVDISQADLKHVTVNGYDADLLIAQSPEEASGLAWANDDTAFYITGFLSENDLMKIAESVALYHAPTEVISNSPIYRPTWLPEGYSEFYINEVDGTNTIIFADNAGQMLKFYYCCNPNATDWHVDATHVSIEATTVNGFPAQILISNDQETASSVMWTTDDNTAFYVSGFLTVEELIEIAESVGIYEEASKGDIPSAINLLDWVS